MSDLARPYKLVFTDPKNPYEFTIDKFLDDKEQQKNLLNWANLYFHSQVMGSPQKTIEAKKYDLSKFFDFYQNQVGHTNIDGWTTAVTKQFQKYLSSLVVPTSGKKYAPTSINRVIATIKHFANWIQKQRSFIAGDPFKGIKDIHVDQPEWNGLDNKQIMRLKSAIEQRLHSCKKKSQNPLLEAAIFYTLLYTGLREAELVSLNRSQYHHRGFHNVKRKGSNITSKVHVPSAAKSFLDDYLKTRDDNLEPLFLSKFNNRFTTLDVHRTCVRIYRQACALLEERDKFKLSPHMLRHTFLKKVADKYGVHFAHKLSGNVSTSVIFRYTKPSEKEIIQKIEEIFE